MIFHYIENENPLPLLWQCGSFQVYLRLLTRLHSHHRMSKLYRNSKFNKQINRENKHVKEGRDAGDKEPRVKNHVTSIIIKLYLG